MVQRVTYTYLKSTDGKLFGGFCEAVITNNTGVCETVFLL